MLGSRGPRPWAPRSAREVEDAREALDAAERRRAAARAGPRRAPGWGAAGALTVDQGSRAVLADDHPARLVREAQFVLVFGTRASIRDELLGALAGPEARP